MLINKVMVKMNNPMIETIFIKNGLQTFISFQLHIAHYKEEYGSISEALKHNDGATILAFPFKVFCSFSQFIANFLNNYKHVCVYLCQKSAIIFFLTGQNLL